MFNVAKIKILHQVGKCEYLTLLVWSKVKKKILVCINSTLYNYFPFFRPRHKLANLRLGEFKTIFKLLSGQISRTICNCKWVKKKWEENDTISL